MARKDRASEGGSGSRTRSAKGQGPRVRDTTGTDAEPLDLPPQSPLFHAEHSGRYERQELIRKYQEKFDCRLIVIFDVIWDDSIALLEELLYDAVPTQKLHMMIDSPGGDGEIAVRMVRAAQARTSELTVIVPDRAKSAATILAMGAHCILMGPTSDLGPVDPQFPVGTPPNRALVAAKDIIAAVGAAEEAIAKEPATYPLHASLLSEVDALMLQRARSALGRTSDLVLEALSSLPTRTDRQASALRTKLKKPLVDLPKDHGAVFGAEDAKKHGLPVESADPQGDQWKIVWRLYSKYFMLGPGTRVYEAEYASRIIPWNQAT